jgi:hypothetical protein
MRWQRNIVAGAVVAAGLTTAMLVGPASPASAAAQTVVQGASATNSSNKSATASCPSGMRVFGGGGDIVGGGHEVRLTGLRPFSIYFNGAYHDSFVATAEEDADGYSGNWTVYSYAICGWALPNMSLQTSTLTSTAGSDRLSTTAGCPTGTAPVGLGAEVTNGHGHVVLNSLLGNYTAGPYGNPSGWSSAQSFVDQVNSTIWSQTSYAVCASAPPSLSYQFRDSAYDSTNDKSASADCPVGTRAYGVGGYLSFLTAELYFDRMVPHGSAWNGGDVNGREDQDGFAPNWWATAETICAAGG